MTLTGLYIFELCKYFVRHMNLFTISNRTYNTRHNFISYPSHTTAVFEKSTYYMVCKVINKLLSLNRELIFNEACLKKVKHYLTENVFYTMSEFFDSTIDIF